MRFEPKSWDWTQQKAACRPLNPSSQPAVNIIDELRTEPLYIPKCLFYSADKKTMESNLQTASEASQGNSNHVASSDTLLPHSECVVTANWLHKAHIASMFSSLVFLENLVIPWWQGYITTAWRLSRVYYT